MAAICRQTRILYRVYAVGYEVWREPTGTATAEWAEPDSAGVSHSVTFRLEQERNRFQEGTDAQRRPGRVWAEYSAEDIISDLREDWFWSDIKARLQSKKDAEAVRFICRYYLTRLRSIEAANPGWHPPADVSPLVEWMRSAVAGSESVAAGRYADEFD